MMETPLISIICLSMNHETFIKQSFESIVGQTYTNIEIIYADNNSSDASFEIADSIFKNSGLPYQGFKREKNYNIPQNLNFLIKKAAGKYISVQSGDDWWELDSIERKVKFYEENQHFGLVYGNGYYYYEDTGKKILPTNAHLFKQGYIFDDVLLGGIYFPVGYIMRSDVFDTVGYYDENIKIDDWDMWLRILKHFPIGYFPEPLVYYRRHENTFCKNIESNFIEALKTVEKYKDEKHYAQAKEMCTRSYLYGLIMAEPCLNTAGKVVKHFKLNLFYVKQMAKVLLASAKLYKVKTH